MKTDKTITSFNDNFYEQYGIGGTDPREKFEKNL